jgi:hypothetical protein
MAAQALHAELDEARRRADMMQDEIDDQLVQCNYQAVKRKQIEIGCKLGTGVTKGPVTGDKVRRGWKRETMIDPATGKTMTDDYGRAVQDPQKPYALDFSYGDQPAYRAVDLWNFFPDMNVADIDDGEGDYERHLFNKKQLRCLKDLRGFDKAAIDRLLRGKPNAGLPSYIADLRNIRGALGQTLMGDIYQVWEYSGPIEPDDARNLALALNNPAMFNDANSAETQLIELNAIVWFCDNEILKFSVYPYDIRRDSMYSVWNFVKDDSSVFGYGMPRLLRDPQAALNAGWRTMMDNMGIAAGPQMIVNQSAVEPADHVYEFAPRKVWLAKSGWIEGQPAGLHHFDRQSPGRARGADRDLRALHRFDVGRAGAGRRRAGHRHHQDRAGHGDPDELDQRRVAGSGEELRRRRDRSRTSAASTIGTCSSPTRRRSRATTTSRRTARACCWCARCRRRT